MSHYEAEAVLPPARAGSSAVVEAVRVTVFGPHFPRRAVEPELFVGKAAAARVRIARDQRSVRGYFLAAPPDGAIRVRYPDSQEGLLREPFARAKIRRLPQECAER